MKALDVSTETIAFSSKLLDVVILGVDHTVQGRHFGLNGINTFAETLVLLGQKQDLQGLAYASSHKPQSSNVKHRFARCNHH